MADVLRVLYIDDEPELLKIAKLYLEMEGTFFVDTISSASIALERLTRERYDAIISDYQMPGIDGLELLKQVRNLHGQIPFILFTGRGREEIVIEAINNGVDFYLQKGGDPKAQFAELVHKIRQGIARRKAEEDLKQSENLYRTIFNTTGAATIIIAPDTTILLANMGWEELTGMPRSEQENKLSWTVFFEKDDVERMVQYHYARRKDPSLAPSVYECRLIDAGKTVHHCVVYVHLIPGTKNSVASLVDITERKEAEDALCKSKNQYDNMVSNIPVGIYILRGRLEGSFSFDYVSPRLVEIFNVSAESFLADPLLGLKPIHPDDLNALLKLNREKFNQERFQQPQPFGWDGRAVVEGASKWIHIESSPVPQENGDVLWNGIVTDITERRRVEEALRQANKKLNLLSGITIHDLKNQLTVLMGYLEILKDTHLDPSQNEQLLKVTIAVKRISSIIQFTKEYEEIGVTAPAWQDTRLLVDSAAKDVVLGNVRVVNDIPDGTTVFADPLIVKVFFNLVDNAVRYGGKIAFIRFSAEKPDGDYVVVCEDDGIGISTGEKEKIFDRGFGKNTGLGLFLSREILDITGIMIRETGEPGRGARFEITVPKGMYR